MGTLVSVAPGPDGRQSREPRKQMLIPHGEEALLQRRLEP
jgi:hypothetical protein